MQILVVVAIIQMKNLKIEAEKGFRRTLFEPELVDPNMEINFVKSTKAFMHLQLCTSIHRKGNNLNYIIHLYKEPRVTYNVILTVSSYNCRVFFSTLMDVLKFSP